MKNIVLFGNDDGRMPAPSGENGEWVLARLLERAFIRAVRQESGGEEGGVAGTLHGWARVP